MAATPRKRVPDDVQTLPDRAQLRRESPGILQQHPAEAACSCRVSSPTHSIDPAPVQQNAIICIGPDATPRLILLRESSAIPRVSVSIECLAPVSSLSVIDYGSVTGARTRTLRLESAISGLFSLLELHSVAHETPMNIGDFYFVRFASSCNFMRFLVHVSPFEPRKSL
jgi:hypothetical protein